MFAKYVGILGIRLLYTTINIHRIINTIMFYFSISYDL